MIKLVVFLYKQHRSFLQPHSWQFEGFILRLWLPTLHWNTGMRQEVVWHPAVICCSTTQQWTTTSRLTCESVCKAWVRRRGACAGSTSCPCSQCSATRRADCTFLSDHHPSTSPHALPMVNAVSLFTYDGSVL